MVKERPRILVAGVGNVLTGDDAFGVRVVERLLENGGPPDGAKVIEVGIGGIHLVQELMDGYDGLVIVDAVDRGERVGTTWTLEPKVPEIAELTEGVRTAMLAETHYAVPAKALTLAKALGVLPRRVRIVGCQPAGLELGIALSDSVAAAIDDAVDRVRAIAAEWKEELDG